MHAQSMIFVAGQFRAPCRWRAKCQRVSRNESWALNHHVASSRQNSPRVPVASKQAALQNGSEELPIIRIEAVNLGKRLWRIESIG